MAQAGKRITRKDLRRPDRFVTLTGQAIDFVRRHRRAALTATAALVVGAVLYAVWDQYQSRQLRLSSQEYAKARRLFEQQNHRQAVDAFTELSRWAPSTYRHLSLLYLANSHMALGEPQKAVEFLERLTLGGFDHQYLKQLAHLSLGFAYEKTDNFTAAAKSYAAAETINGPFNEEAVLGMARASNQAGDPRAALDSYRNYLATFQGSERRTEIALRVRELEAKIGKETGGGRN